MKRATFSKSLTLSTALVLVCVSAYGADTAPPKKKRVKKHTTTTTTQPTTDTEDQSGTRAPSHPTGQRPELGGGAVIGVIGGNFTLGIQAQMMFQIAAVPGLSVGPETGFYHSSVSTGVSGLSASVNSFPILAAGLFTLPESAQFWKGTNLYAGAAMGLSFSSGSASGSVAGSTVTSTSSSSTDFVFLVRPGLRFGGDSGHLFYAETMFGSFGGSFAFLPTFGVTLPL